MVFSWNRIWNSHCLACDWRKCFCSKERVPIHCHQRGDSGLFALPWWAELFVHLRDYLNCIYQPVHTLYRLFFMPLYTNSTVLAMADSYDSYILSVHFPESRITIQKVNRQHTPTVLRSIRLGLERTIARWRKSIRKNQGYSPETGLKHGRFDYAGREGYSRKSKTTLHKGDYPHDTLPGVPPVAAVCYPNFCADCQKNTRWFRCKSCSQSQLHFQQECLRKVKVRETKWAVNEGADEIDMVISRDISLPVIIILCLMKSRLWKACGDAHLKVILETGELSTLDNVRIASDLAMNAGADFIKTSTEKFNLRLLFLWLW